MKPLAAVAAVLLTVVGFAALLSITITSAWRHDEVRDACAAPATVVEMPAASVGPTLDTPLSDPRSFKVSCGTVDGGAATDMRIPMDGGGPPVQSESFWFTNTSSTCVRVSGSDVTATTGQEIGSGCPGGESAAMDARVGKCQSEGAAQQIDVTLGRR